jgi:hypothetical protein
MTVSSYPYPCLHTQHKCGCAECAGVEACPSAVLRADAQRGDRGTRRERSTATPERGPGLPALSDADKASRPPTTRLAFLVFPLAHAKGRAHWDPAHSATRQAGSPSAKASFLAARPERPLAKRTRHAHSRTRCLRRCAQGEKGQPVWPPPPPRPIRPPLTRPCSLRRCATARSGTVVGETEHHDMSTATISEAHAAYNFAHTALHV